MSWYLADVVMQVHNAVHVNTCLIEARSPDEAYEKALALGVGDEEDGARFVGLASLNAIHEPLADGSEIAFVAHPGGDALAKKLARAREELAIFGGARTEEAGRVVTIDHAQVMFAPADERAMREFYSRVLGFVAIDKPEPLRARGGFWMLAGDRQVHFGVETSELDRRQTRAHVAYEVHGLDAIRARLAAAGVAITEGETLDGIRRFEFRDPAGNRVELIEHPIRA